jgi:ATP-dependent Lon protease
VVDPFEPVPAELSEPEGIVSEVPVLPVRGSVLFPHTVQPLTVGRPGSLRALDAANESAPPLIAVAGQRDPSMVLPSGADLFDIGTLGRVHRRVELPTEQGQMRLAIVEGLYRARLDYIESDGGYLLAHATRLADLPSSAPSPEYRALAANVHELFREIVRDSSSLPDELLPMEAAIEEEGFLADWVANAMPLSNEVKQELLQTLDVEQRMKMLVEQLVRLREDQRLQMKIRSDVAEKISESQRRSMLREQMQAIQRELGEGDQSSRELADLRKRIDEAGLSEEAQSAADRELSRLEGIPPQSAEYPLACTYLEWLADLPWSKSTEQELELDKAKQVLDEDHYGLQSVKDRILEHLAVYRLKRDLKGPILCLVGPPGTGKTSVGKSVARAMGRAFGHFSLGGMHDEAEIRGHRRTYVGARPGQIIYTLKRAGANDPVIMLDEVDKLGRDFRGDPAAALLEVLDPEQNHAFRDHYLEVPFDLSRVLFITTANLLDTIPRPLLDRMEVIELNSYVDDEKLHIADGYLVPRQLERNGLTTEQLGFTEEGLRSIIRGYTREAGVRRLEQQIAAVCRKRALGLLTGGTEKLEVTPEVVHDLLGVERFKPEGELAERTARPGVAIALAWTPAGGEVLFVEAARMREGRGTFKITGQVREVMQESAGAALTWVRAHAPTFGVDPATFKDADIHLHVPSGAVPKDGPSAGVVMVVALLSSLTDHRVRPDVALTGEISLSGLILPVGGIREKVLAAKRLGVKEVVLPIANKADYEEDLPEHLREGLTVSFVRTIEEAIKRAFPDEAAALKARPPTTLSLTATS